MTEPKLTTTPRTAGDLAGLVERLNTDADRLKLSKRGDLHAILGDVREAATAITTLQAEVERITKERDEALENVERYVAVAREEKERAEAAEAELARQGAAVAVKPLEWFPEGDDGTDDIADTICGRYWVAWTSYLYRLVFIYQDGESIFQTELGQRMSREDAQSVAQAHYESTLRSALAPPATDKGAATETAAPERAKFPILNSQGQNIDYALVADHGGQAQKNHYQSVKTLANRGGLSWCELYAVLHNKRYEKMDQNEAMLACRSLEARYLAALNAALGAVSAPAGWQDIETAPHACHVLATRFDHDCGEWVSDVVLSPPIYPFTHWRPLPAAPTVQAGRMDHG